MFCTICIWVLIHKDHATTPFPNKLLPFYPPVWMPSLYVSLKFTLILDLPRLVVDNPGTSWKVVVAGVSIGWNKLGKRVGLRGSTILFALGPAGQKHLTPHWKMKRVAQVTHAISGSPIPSPNPSDEKLGDVDRFGLATYAETSHQKFFHIYSTAFVLGQTRRPFSQIRMMGLRRLGLGGLRGNSLKAVKQQTLSPIKSRDRPSLNPELTQRWHCFFSRH